MSSSSKPTDPGTSGVPFGSALNDSMAFARRLWDATGLPSLPTATGMSQFAQGLPGALPNLIAPTFDVAELDKRIADLRAVEQWLSLNVSMLNTTIQTLEVQRNTIATLKSFSGAMMSALGRSDPPAATAAPPARAGTTTPPADASRTSRWREPASPTELTGWPAVTSRTGPAAVGSPSSQAPTPVPPQTAASTPASTASDSAPPVPQRPAGAAEVAPALIAGMPINPALWWGALQDQFTRIAAASVALGAAGEPTTGRAAAEVAPGGGASSGADAAPAPRAPGAHRARKAAARSPRTADDPAPPGRPSRSRRGPSGEAA